MNGTGLAVPFFGWRHERASLSGKGGFGLTGANGAGAGTKDTIRLPK